MHLIEFFPSIHLDDYSVADPEFPRQGWRAVDAAYYSAKFSRKLLENEEIWAGGALFGARANVIMHIFIAC